MTLHAVTARSVVGRPTQILVILLSLLSAPALAAGQNQLTLMDGSVISGEVTSVEGGVYSIKSPSLGTITVKAAEIRKIEMTGVASATESAPNMQSAPSASSNSQLEDLQRRILGDDSVMNSVTALQGDPLFQDILNDPSILDALRSGNLEALERNPKVLRLMDDPRVKDITRKLPQ